MKRLVIMVLLVAALAAGWMIVAREALDSVSVQVVFGEPTERGIPMDIVLTGRYTHADRPDSSSAPNWKWQRWLDAHFEMRDQAGTKIAIKYDHVSDRIHDFGGRVGVGYIKAILEPGQQYILRYQRTVGASEAYEGGIVAPNEAKTMHLITLALVNDGES